MSRLASKFLSSLSILLISSVFSFANQVQASKSAGLRFSSGLHQTTLIELFTSEGCSSCPPADEYLRQFKDNPKLWIDVIPVSFHVDYWDYIGWKDPFAQAQFSERQRIYAREWNSASIYTPGFALNGKEWKGWRAGKIPESRGTVFGNLELVIDKDKSMTIHLTHQNKKNLFAYVALLGMNINSQVLRGENRGQNLGHEFVVLELKRVSLTPGDAGLSASLPAFETGPSGHGKYAVAAWVTEKNSLRPLQSTGGFVP